MCRAVHSDIGCCTSGACFYFCLCLRWLSSWCVRQLVISHHIWYVFIKSVTVSELNWRAIPWKAVAACCCRMWIRLSIRHRNGCGFKRAKSQSKKNYSSSIDEMDAIKQTNTNLNKTTEGGGKLKQWSYHLR